MIKDTQITELIDLEEGRQKKTVNLIASENYSSPEVRSATGSVCSDKYAEGYPTKRYYAGCEIIDEIEKIAIDRCKELFQAQHANVQPHSGSQANMAAYFAVLQPGDTILGMQLAAGGHLTHGHAINFSGIFYKVVQYGVNPLTEQIDYDNFNKLAQQYKPKLIVVGASAYSRIIDFKKCADIAQSVGALLLADIAHIAGLVVAGLHPNPFPHADIVTSTTHKTLRGPRGGIIMCKKELATVIDKAIMPGIQGGPFMNVIAAKAIAFKQALNPSFQKYQYQTIANAHKLATTLHKMHGYRIVAEKTENHLFIIDLRSKSCTGKAAEIALEKIGITASRSCIPFDPEKPWITSGIRLGTPAVTTRGMKEHDMELIAEWINQAIENRMNDIQLCRIKDEVKKFAFSFPLFADF